MSQKDGYIDAPLHHIYDWQLSYIMSQQYTCMDALLVLYHLCEWKLI